MKSSLYVVACLFFLSLSLNGMTVIAGNGGGGGGGGGGVTGSGGTGMTVISGGGGGGTTVIAGGGSGGGGGTGGNEPSEQGQLYGDLYVIARYMGGETKNVPAFDASGNPIMVQVPGNPLVCGSTPCQVWQQAWTTATAVGGEPKLSEIFATYQVLDDYDVPVPNPATGTLYYPAPYPSQCVQPVADSVRWGDISTKTGLSENRLPLDYIYDATHSTTDCAVTDAVFLAAGEVWNSVTYYTAISYPQLIQEVSFGRLSLARAPEAIHLMAFDEAISNLNNAKKIVLDATGRLVLTTDVYDEFLTNPDGSPVWLEEVTKTIDSPRENLAIYVKLMKDGNLITPANERAPVDMSIKGGSTKVIEDGPSTTLRPTINIKLMKDMGLGSLVDAANITHYYAKYDKTSGEVLVSPSPLPGYEQAYGIIERAPSDVCSGDDLAFGATFFASAADKSGSITMDQIVYLNSILGINKVVGLSDDGTINYSKNPVYFNFATNPYEYGRKDTFLHRGRVSTNPGGGSPATYDGFVNVLVEDALHPGTWVDTPMPIFGTVFGSVDYSGTNISGFTTMADDDVQTIGYIHTYQIPGLR
ncbi:MAG: hypothetical protein Q8R42_07235 [Desulfocapsaceae bacterium]|nr:hypothetical protein [Desulfocapsaceae bacterium]